ncbi:MAG: 3-dehydroquinate synthase [SAR324 cluster bacterium]|nr:3-dehydroquinate synthase [SAR324 cluster bacterium]
MKTLEVKLPGGVYPIHIGAGTLDSHLAAMVGGIATELVVVITSRTLNEDCPQHVRHAVKSLADLPLRVETCLIPGGEENKNMHTLASIYDRLMELEANRSTVLVAFGGGIVGDVVGFAAATFMRGIEVVQVPTTLLAQVDSSVGGKTAVNHPHGKNTIGAFKQPVGVIIDLTMLETLPERELRAGLFELIKHGIIRDPELLEYLEQNAEKFGGRDWKFWEEAVYRSCRVKAGVVQEDEREGGLRAILNFGHSLAHLIETHTGYNAYLHGEAVGAGMLFAAFVSQAMGCISGEDFSRLRQVLEPLTAPIMLPPLGRDGFTKLLMHDKKAANRTINFILLDQVGHAFIRGGTTPEELWPLFQQFLEEMPGVLRVGDG